MSAEGSTAGDFAVKVGRWGFALGIQSTLYSSFLALLFFLGPPGNGIAVSSQR